VSREVVWEERAISQASRFLDDPQGLREVLDAVGRLADEPRPGTSFPYGSPEHRPEYRRLRVGRYRVMYEITEDTISVGNIAHGTSRS
jgi:mRNA interferase RelE/StbE